LRRCTRCHGNIIAQRFVEVYGRGMRWSCLACAEEAEQLDEELIPPWTRLLKSRQREAGDHVEAGHRPAQR